MPRRMRISRAYQLAAEPSQVRIAPAGKRGENSQDTRWGLMGVCVVHGSALERLPLVGDIALDFVPPLTRGLIPYYLRSFVKLGPSGGPPFGSTLESRAC
jgi:hypothetical protein